MKCTVLYVPGPDSTDVPMFLVLTMTQFPGPLAAARGEERGTWVWEKKKIESELKEKRREGLIAKK